MGGFAAVSKLPPNAQQEEAKGRRYPVACKTWFTSEGEVLPLSFKFKDDNGELQMVKHLTVKWSEDRNYSGIPSKEFLCEAVIGGFLREFRMIFDTGSCEWKLVI
ncbi:MAG TPA: hypothetical protein IAB28_00515 [Candidatus Copromonas faecavium]|uniref:Uncharacterized protein n=1 Tax=Candidatus Copromonas faecavium (nom. illeg.) TaxID=2840740 RepID=A0A9D1A1U8_9FIRM|nr:hypothetical protein [Candidatus Copromonas faecavium]